MTDELRALLADEPERVFEKGPGQNVGGWIENPGADLNAFRAELRPYVEVLLTRIAILEDKQNRCISCMEPISPLHPRCTCIWSEIAELENERDRYKAALEEIVYEADKTLAWRQGGMRPATDISLFRATAQSSVIRIRRYMLDALAALQGGTE